MSLGAPARIALQIKAGGDQPLAEKIKILASRFAGQIILKRVAKERLNC